MRIYCCFSPHFPFHICLLFAHRSLGLSTGSYDPPVPSKAVTLQLSIGMDWSLSDYAERLLRWAFPAYPHG